MKRVPLIDRGTFKALEILKAIAKTPPQGANGSAGIDFETMKKRVRVLDVLDACTEDYVLLEDSDYSLLQSAMKSFQFGIADANLLAILQDIDEAKAP